MRHFMTQKLVLEALSVSRLPHRLQSSRPRLDPVRGSRTTDRLTAPRRSALVAQPLTPIAATADSKLDSTSLADREPVL
jgi:hypothetical protein